MLIREVTVAQRGADSLSGVKHTVENGVELLLVLEGSGHVLMGGELFPLRRGVLFLIDSDCLHCSVPEVGSDYVRHKLLLERQAFLSLSSLVGSSLAQGGCFVLGEDEIEEVSRLVILLSEQISAQGWEALRALSRILELCETSAESRTARTVPVDPILDYINRNLDQPLSLELLAKETHFSKYYLCDLFRRRTGMTPMQYVRLLRISRAQRLLLGTADSVSNIGLACGYDNFSFFCRVFRSVSGMSPSEYRKRMGGREGKNDQTEK